MLHLPLSPGPSPAAAAALHARRLPLLPRPPPRSPAFASIRALRPPSPLRATSRHAPVPPHACPPALLHSACQQRAFQPISHGADHRLRCAAVVAAGAGGQQFSVSDGELMARGISVHWDTAQLDYAKLDDLFYRAGFPRRGPKKLQRAMGHSTLVLWFSAPEASPSDTRPFFSSSPSPSSPAPGGPEAGVEPVAFARTAGDGVFNEVVWDVAVDPRLQGSGLGRALMERLVDALLRSGVRNVGLFAEQRVVTFYRPLGFAMDPDGITCMAHRSQEKRGKL
ncbi:hypothetical protein CLOM_g11745 [Closterium sp. NIES-68]|nr:hypothetical protein CLOM_g11745 [Closterium sp. NIES-68]GJP76535.1 hypothetical protein CLOP_g6966 [Closterium sp. NIES-67]